MDFPWDKVGEDVADAVGWDAATKEVAAAGAINTHHVQTTCIMKQVAELVEDVVAGVLSHKHQGCRHKGLSSPKLHRIPRPLIQAC